MALDRGRCRPLAGLRWRDQRLLGAARPTSCRRCGDDLPVNAAGWPARTTTCPVEYRDGRRAKHEIGGAGGESSGKRKGGSTMAIMPPSSETTCPGARNRRPAASVPPLAAAGFICAGAVKKRRRCASRPWRRPRSSSGPPGDLEEIAVGANVGLEKLPAAQRRSRALRGPCTSSDRS